MNRQNSKSVSGMFFATLLSGFGATLLVVALIFQVEKVQAYSDVNETLQSYQSCLVHRSQYSPEYEQLLTRRQKNFDHEILASFDRWALEAVFNPNFKAYPFSEAQVQSAIGDGILSYGQLLRNEFCLDPAGQYENAEITGAMVEMLGNEGDRAVLVFKILIRVDVQTSIKSGGWMLREVRLKSFLNEKCPSDMTAMKPSETKMFTQNAKAIAAICSSSGRLWAWIP